MGWNSNSSKRNTGKLETSAPEFDDLIPGFGGSSPPKNESSSDLSRPQKSSGHSAKLTNLAEDPFVVLESSSSRLYNSGLFPDPSKKDTGKNLAPSSIDELEDFSMGRMWNNSNKQSDVLLGDVEIETSIAARKEDTYGAEAKQRKQRGAFESDNDLESFFSIGAVPRRSTKTVDPVFDTLFQKRVPEVARPPSRTSSSTKKSPSVTNIVDDFSFFFGAAPSSGEFQEIEGETEER